MRNLTPTSITQAFADYAKNAPSERTRTLLDKSLHAIVRLIQLSGLPLMRPVRKTVLEIVETITG